MSKTSFEPLYGLSGNLWPIHLKPQPDELLSIWIIRLAHAHGLKVETFCTLLFGRGSKIWNRDLDNLAPAYVLVTLAKITGASAIQTHTTTIRSFDGTLYERHNSQGNNPWIVPLGIYHRQRSRPGLMYCPDCLNSDKEPYFRKQWRTAFTTVCTTHNVYLRDTCPRCSAPIAPHRTDMRGKDLVPRRRLLFFCWQCGFDLRDTDTLIQHEPATLLLNFQRLCEKAINDGYLEWAGNSSMYSLLFFDGLRALARGLMSMRSRKRLRNSRDNQIKTLAELKWTSKGLEGTSLTQRRILFETIAELISDWPHEYIAFIEQYKLTFSDLTGDHPNSVFWYEDVIRKNTFKKYARVTRQEVSAIIQSTEALPVRFSPSLARNLYGRDIARHVKNISQRVSYDHYESLLTSIDHEIGGTVNQTHRALLIRDKIMFAFARHLQLTCKEISELTKPQISSLVPQCAKLSFFEPAGSPEQARAWVEWYWNTLRPLPAPAEHHNYVFTSFYSKKGLKETSVGARFQRAVKAAQLHREIPSYNCWVNTKLST